VLCGVQIPHEGLGLLRVGGGAAVVEVGGEGHQARRGQLVAGPADVRQQPVPVVHYQHAGPSGRRAGRLGQVEAFLGHTSSCTVSSTVCGFWQFCVVTSGYDCRQTR